MPLSFSRVNISLDCIHFVLYVKGYFSVCTIAKMIFCKSKAIFKFFSTSRTGKKLSSSVNKWARPVDGFPTEIRIYSSFTKELEPFILNEKGIVKWYSCGPTVYDKAHIGHACKYFGSQIDIHSGGIDLLFPHHENEEAQCCAYHNISQWVNYWIHSGHLFLKGTTKMSKSLENTIDVDECLEKYTPNDFRFMCLLSRYRNSLEYESDIMNKAISLRKKFGTFLENTSDFIRSLHNQGNVDEVKLFKALQETEENVRSALANDFNTVRAMSLLTDIVSLTNNMIQAESSSPFESKGIVAVACVANFVKKTLSLLGVDYEPTQVSKSSLNLMEDVVSTSVAFRNQIRKVAIAALKEKENNNKRESLLPHKIADYPYQKVGMDYMEFNKDLYIVIVDYCSQYPEIAKISNTKASSLITQVLDATNTFKSLLQACDQFRDEFLTAGIVIRDHKDQSAWSFDKNKNT
ncbi:probable cysteine--tRNA ligase, mitochondrial isoform X5 [Bemisia tabaci]|uniref:probable cysteine--tRNA ligase, mitochondrial isoform X5 n=1 Tax=Bemisia tabaci TaxID=7038 RepID=UPI003B28A9C5